MSRAREQITSVWVEVYNTSTIKCGGKEQARIGRSLDGDKGLLPLNEVA